MGKRSKNPQPILTPPTPQERADSFDRQHRVSVARAAAKRAAGDYPYDWDYKLGK